MEKVKVMVVKVVVVLDLWVPSVFCSVYLFVCDRCHRPSRGCHCPSRGDRSGDRSRGDRSRGDRSHRSPSRSHSSPSRSHSSHSNYNTMGDDTNSMGNNMDSVGMGNAGSNVCQTLGEGWI